MRKCGKQRALYHEKPVLAKKELQIVHEIDKKD
jgi:hypothetical protein